MPKRRNDSNGRRPTRRDLAAWLMMLLPGFMFVGLLAPAAIHVKPRVEEKTAAVSEISFRNFKPRRVLQLPAAVAHSVVPDAGLDTVFTGARYLGEQARRVFEIEAKNEPKSEQQIVLNEEKTVQKYVAETLFDQQTDTPQLVVDLTPLWDPMLFDIIPPLINRMNYNQWDDFHGTGVKGTNIPPQQQPVVPEPTTGALLAFGLVALAVAGRNRA